MLKVNGDTGGKGSGSCDEEREREAESQKTWCSFSVMFVCLFVCLADCFYMDSIVWCFLLWVCFLYTF